MARSVLLIDDNAIQAATRQAILRRAGWHVMATLSAERALEQVRAGDFAIPLGLVITDHFMPGMSGSVFVRSLRKTHPLIPVMVISGLEEAEAEYEGLGVIFRVKPLMPEVLLSEVQALMQLDYVSPDANPKGSQDTQDTNVSQDSGVPQDSGVSQDSSAQVSPEPSSQRSHSPGTNR